MWFIYELDSHFFFVIDVILWHFTMVIQVLLLFWGTIVVLHFQTILSHHQTEPSYILKLMNLWKKLDLNSNTWPSVIDVFWFLNSLLTAKYIEINNATFKIKVQEFVSLLREKDELLKSTNFTKQITSLETPWYNCNNITKTSIQISNNNWNGFFSNIIGWFN